ncbi:tRNA lysidine(34) synthetase TilS [Peteryoungia desertarenae]|uniref:tRNA(Ile)-lysidine synthase n=1 Tax=Peteryoungia desertarenae TaxID=1813451 RepID=A0ABX6QRL6_9HYPH|nr:tRNA lysidine(34) synthetase TilS [Peteryoungia desertarenae]QLF71180.1 tRNA lysidine(34) synthetase TilS [Peteryoungia desertarenae]
MTVPDPLRETQSPQETAQRFLQRLKEPSRICVAVSGGSDSLGALLALHSANAREQRHSLYAITVDHALRSEAAEEAIKVGEICHTLGIHHQIRRWTGEKPDSGLPAKAREARYNLLREAADGLGSSVLVTGHTLDDQAETIAMRRTRNDQNNRGLSGMAEATLYRRSLWIMRPFLATRRVAFRMLLLERNLSWIEDPSNDNDRYERVQKRKAGVVADLAELTRHAKARLERSDKVARWIRGACRLEAGSILRIKGDALHKDPETLVEAMSVLLAVMGGKAHLPPKTRVEQMLTDLASEAMRRFTLSRTLVVAQPDEVWMMREKRGLLPLFLEPGEEKLWDGRFSIRNVTEAMGRIDPGPVEGAPAELPAPLKPSILSTWPHMILDNSLNQSVKAATMEHFIPLIDNFLPSFDLVMAEALNDLFGREPLSAPPV